MEINLYTWITEFLGEWVADYPYIFGTIEIVIILIALIFLQNMLYALTKFIAGER